MNLTSGRKEAVPQRDEDDEEEALLSERWMKRHKLVLQPAVNLAIMSPFKIYGTCRRKRRRRRAPGCPGNTESLITHCLFSLMF